MGKASGWDKIKKKREQDAAAKRGARTLFQVGLTRNQPPSDSSSDSGINSSASSPIPMSQHDQPEQLNDYRIEDTVPSDIQLFPITLAKTTDASRSQTVLTTSEESDRHPNQPAPSAEPLSTKVTSVTPDQNPSFEQGKILEFI